MNKFSNKLWRALLTLISLCLMMDPCAPSKVIIFHHLASYSHRVQTFPLATELSSRGHEVTYISPYHPKEPNPNITEIVIPEHQELIGKFIESEMDINLKVNREMLDMIDFVFDMGVDVCDALFSSKDFKIWLEANPKADLVIIDNCLAECGTGLAHKLGAKYIYFSTVPIFGHEYDSIGFLPEASAIPELETYALTPPFNFFERLSNALESLRWRWEHLYYAERIDKVIREKLDMPEMPYIEDLLRNVSLIFYTGDVVSDFPRSLPPLFVNIAGIAKKSVKPLPKEMEDFISSNSANTTSSLSGPDDGFIYISLGSMIVSSNLPQYMKDIFFSVVRAFPHIKFLWKWNGDFPANIPSNLYLSKWFPQVDILGHPKIRGFITQCGRPSLMEALFNGVPMISFPIVGDQEINADRLKAMGAMVRLDIAQLNFDDLRDGVEQVLYDSGIKSRMKRLQEIFLDRPMTPVDTAVWWTEYVLRNEDTAHLRPAGSEQYWFVRRQIDVWAFLSITAFLSISLIVFGMGKLYSVYVKPTNKLKSN